MTTLLCKASTTLCIDPRMTLFFHRYVTVNLVSIQGVVEEFSFGFRKHQHLADIISGLRLNSAGNKVLTSLTSAL